MDPQLMALLSQLYQAYGGTQPGGGMQGMMQNLMGGGGANQTMAGPPGRFDQSMPYRPPGAPTPWGTNPGPRPMPMGPGFPGGPPIGSGPRGPITAPGGPNRPRQGGNTTMPTPGDRPRQGGGMGGGPMWTAPGGGGGQNRPRQGNPTVPADRPRYGGGGQYRI